MKDRHIEISMATCPDPKCGVELGGFDVQHIDGCAWLYFNRHLTPISEDRPMPVWLTDAIQGINRRQKWIPLKPSLGEFCPRCHCRGDKTRLFQQQVETGTDYDCGRCGYTAREFRRAS